MLTGTGQLFIQSETGIRPWTILKSLLIQEFVYRLISTDVHRKLFSTITNNDESFHQYLLMKEIDMHVCMEILKKMLIVII